MLIIAGKVYVAPEARDTYVESHRELIKQARNAPGCVDLAISADPIDPRRVNMLEQWESEDHLAAFRAVARPPEATTAIVGGDVQKHQISSSGPPFDD